MRYTMNSLEEPSATLMVFSKIGLFVAHNPDKLATLLDLVKVLCISWVRKGIYQVSLTG